MGRVILLEFNELTPALMDRFIAEGRLPAFKTLRDQSVAAITDAGEDPPYLEPWIQWVTVHTGLSYAEHKVFDLGDGPKLRAPRVWDMVSHAGKPVWVCGSMNAAVLAEPLNGKVLPDPWSTGLRPVPDREFAPFFDFISAYVQEYTRDKPPIGRAATLRFLRFMAAHGLSPRTVATTLRQLAGEAAGKMPKWKRAVILDAMLWDVFRHQYRKLNPVLSTFFLNSTAHFQHYYWRALDPAAFALAAPEEAAADHAEAIRFGYEKMDAIVADALAMAGPDTTIILCTALGQQPLTKYDADGGRNLFKPIEPQTLMAFAGVEGGDYKPVMAEEFRLFFADEAAADDALAKLRTLRLDDGQTVMKARKTGPTEVYTGCDIGTVPGPDARVIAPGSNRTMRFAELFYRVDTGIKSGMHHRDGLLWIRKPGEAPRTIDRRVSLQEIAPTLLRLCDVEAPIGFACPALPELFGEAEGPRKAA